MQEILSPAIFKERRQKLMRALDANSSVILFAPENKQRNNDVHYPFRQESYFWYFTGFPEPGAVALLCRENDTVKYTLFNAVRDASKEIWEGKIIGQEGALNDYEVDESLPLEQLSQLPNKLQHSKKIYTILGNDADNDARIGEILRIIHAQCGRGGADVDGIFDLRRIADELRILKCAQERNLLCKAGAISAAGHRAAMHSARAGLYEYQVQAALEASFRYSGCDWSFPSIVAAGANACCLHYRANNCQLKDGDLLLVDAGAEYAGYAGDITRTFPINGKFSTPQRILYEIVLNAQKNAIANARPEITHLQLHELTIASLIQGMLDAQIIKGNLQDWLAEDRYKQFYMHGTGHWLGLDVHDVGIYKPQGQSRRYLPEMAFTIEPGLYIQANDFSVGEQWRGIGIRIEDDIIITATQTIITSADAPKEVAEIEDLLKIKKSFSFA